MAADPTMPVLVVDDFRMMARIMRTLLGQIGYTEIDEAAGGVEALDKMRERRYGLIISDWNMKGMDGLELLKQVRALPQFKATPFIMVSGEARADVVIAAKKAGVSAYIVKPFTAQTLKGKIEEAGRVAAGGGA